MSQNYNLKTSFVKLFFQLFFIIRDNSLYVSGEKMQFLAII